PRRRNRKMMPRLTPAQSQWSVGYRPAKAGPSLYARRRPERPLKARIPELAAIGFPSPLLRIRRAPVEWRGSCPDSNVTCVAGGDVPVYTPYGYMVQWLRNRILTRPNRRSWTASIAWTARCVASRGWWRKTVIALTC